MDSGLNESLANRVVKRIMNTLDYNINIMDEKGVIIASGDESRIGQVHKGAVEAIKFGTTREIFEDTETEKKGINKPIIVDRKILGVIGISGNPNEVGKFADLITITAQLMIEQQFYVNVEEVKQTRFRDFLNEWIYKKDSNFDEDFRLRAELLEIDLSIKRIVAFLKMDKLTYNLYANYSVFLSKNEYVMRYGLQNVLLLMDANSNYLEKINKIIEKDSNIITCAISKSNLILADSLLQAERVSKILSTSISNQKIGKFEEFDLMVSIFESSIGSSLASLIQNLVEQDKKGELLETIDAYFKLNGEINAISRYMFIHRNTLSYRINRIQEITGLDLHLFSDRIKIYFSLLSYKYLTTRKTQ